MALRAFKGRKKSEGPKSPASGSSAEAGSIASPNSPVSPNTPKRKNTKLIPSFGKSRSDVPSQPVDKAAGPSTPQAGKVTGQEHIAADSAASSEAGTLHGSSSSSDMRKRFRMPSAMSLNNKRSFGFGRSASAAAQQPPSQLSSDSRQLTPQVSRNSTMPSTMPATPATPATPASSGGMSALFQESIAPRSSGLTATPATSATSGGMSALFQEPLAPRPSGPTATPASAPKTPATDRMPETPTTTSRKGKDKMTEGLPASQLEKAKFFSPGNLIKKKSSSKTLRSVAASDKSENPGEIITFSKPVTVQRATSTPATPARAPETLSTAAAASASATSKNGASGGSPLLPRAPPTPSLVRTDTKSGAAPSIVGAGQRVSRDSFYSAPFASPSESVNTLHGATPSTDIKNTSTVLSYLTGSSAQPRGELSDVSTATVIYRPSEDVPVSESPEFPTAQYEGATFDLDADEVSLDGTHASHATTVMYDALDEIETQSSSSQSDVPIVVASAGGESTQPILKGFKDPYAAKDSASQKSEADQAAVSFSTPKPESLPASKTDTSTPKPEVAPAAKMTASSSTKSLSQSKNLPARPAEEKDIAVNPEDKSNATVSNVASNLPESKNESVMTKADDVRKLEPPIDMSASANKNMDVGEAARGKAADEAAPASAKHSAAEPSSKTQHKDEQADTLHKTENISLAEPVSPEVPKKDKFESKAHTSPRRENPTPPSVKDVVVPEKHASSSSHPSSPYSSFALAPVAKERAVSSTPLQPVQKDANHKAPAQRSKSASGPRATKAKPVLLVDPISPPTPALRPQERKDLTLGERSGIQEKPSVSTKLPVTKDVPAIPTAEKTTDTANAKISVMPEMKPEMTNQVDATPKLDKKPDAPASAAAQHSPAPAIMGGWSFLMPSFAAKESTSVLMENKPKVEDKADEDAEDKAEPTATDTVLMAAAAIAGAATGTVLTGVSTMKDVVVSENDSKIEDAEKAEEIIKKSRDENVADLEPTGDEEPRREDGGVVSTPGPVKEEMTPSKEQSVCELDVASSEPLSKEAQSAADKRTGMGALSEPHADENRASIAATEMSSSEANKTSDFAPESVVREADDSSFVPQPTSSENEAGKPTFSSEGKPERAGAEPQAATNLASELSREDKHLSATESIAQAAATIAGAATGAVMAGVSTVKDAVMAETESKSDEVERSEPSTLSDVGALGSNAEPAESVASDPSTVRPSESVQFKAESVTPLPDTKQDVSAQVGAPAFASDEPANPQADEGPSVGESVSMAATAIAGAASGVVLAGVSTVTDAVTPETKSDENAMKPSREAAEAISDVAIEKAPVDAAVPAATSTAPAELEVAKPSTSVPDDMAKPTAPQPDAMPKPASKDEEVVAEAAQFTTHAANDASASTVAAQPGKTVAQQQPTKPDVQTPEPEPILGKVPQTSATAFNSEAPLTPQHQPTLSESSTTTHTPESKTIGTSAEPSPSSKRRGSLFKAAGDFFSSASLPFSRSSRFNDSSRKSSKGDNKSELVSDTKPKLTEAAEAAEASKTAQDDSPVPVESAAEETRPHSAVPVHIGSAAEEARPLSDAPVHIETSTEETRPQSDAPAPIENATQEARPPSDVPVHIESAAEEARPPSDVPVHIESAAEEARPQPHVPVHNDNATLGTRPQSDAPVHLENAAPSMVPGISPLTANFAPFGWGSKLPWAVGTVPLPQRAQMSNPAMPGLPPTAKSGGMDFLQPQPIADAEQPQPEHLSGEQPSADTQRSQPEFDSNEQPSADTQRPQPGFDSNEQPSADTQRPQPGFNSNEQPSADTQRPQPEFDSNEQPSADTQQPQPGFNSNEQPSADTQRPQPEFDSNEQPVADTQQSQPGFNSNEQPSADTQRPQPEFDSNEQPVADTQQSQSEHRSSAQTGNKKQHPSHAWLAEDLASSSARQSMDGSQRYSLSTPWPSGPKLDLSMPADVNKTLGEAVSSEPPPLPDKEDHNSVSHIEAAQWQRHASSTQQDHDPTTSLPAGTQPWGDAYAGLEPSEMPSERNRWSSEYSQDAMQGQYGEQGFSDLANEEPSRRYALDSQAEPESYGMSFEPRFLHTVPEETNPEDSYQTDSHAASTAVAAPDAAAAQTQTQSIPTAALPPVTESLASLSSVPAGAPLEGTGQYDPYQLRGFIRAMDADNYEHAMRRASRMGVPLAEIPSNKPVQYPDPPANLPRPSELFAGKGVRWDSSDWLRSQLRKNVEAPSQAKFHAFLKTRRQIIPAFVWHDAASDPALQGEKYVDISEPPSTKSQAKELESEAAPEPAPAGQDPRANGSERAETLASTSAQPPAYLGMSTERQPESGAPDSAALQEPANIVSSQSFSFENSANPLFSLDSYLMTDSDPIEKSLFSMDQLEKSYQGRSRPIHNLTTDPTQVQPPLVYNPPVVPLTSPAVVTEAPAPTVPPKIDEQSLPSSTPARPFVDASDWTEQRAEGPIPQPQFQQAQPHGHMFYQQPPTQLETQPQATTQSSFEQPHASADSQYMDQLMSHWERPEQPEDYQLSSQPQSRYSSWQPEPQDQIQDKWQSEQMQQSWQQDAQAQPRHSWLNEQQQQFAPQMPYHQGDSMSQNFAPYGRYPQQPQSGAEYEPGAEYLRDQPGLHREGAQPESAHPPSPPAEDHDYRGGYWEQRGFGQQPGVHDKPELMHDLKRSHGGVPASVSPEYSQYPGGDTLARAKSYGHEQQPYQGHHAFNHYGDSNVPASQPGFAQAYPAQADPRMQRAQMQPQPNLHTHPHMLQQQQQQQQQQHMLPPHQLGQLPPPHSQFPHRQPHHPPYQAYPPSYPPPPQSQPYPHMPQPPRSPMGPSMHMHPFVQGQPGMYDQYPIQRADSWHHWQHQPQPMPQPHQYSSTPSSPQMSSHQSRPQFMQHPPMQQQRQYMPSQAGQGPDDQQIEYGFAEQAPVASNGQWEQQDAAPPSPSWSTPGRLQDPNSSMQADTSMSAVSMTPGAKTKKKSKVSSPMSPGASADMYGSQRNKSKRRGASSGRSGWAALLHNDPLSALD